MLLLLFSFLNFGCWYFHGDVYFCIRGPVFFWFKSCPLSPWWLICFCSTNLSSRFEPLRNNSCKTSPHFLSMKNAPNIDNSDIFPVTSRSWNKMRFKKMKTIRLKSLKNLSKKMLPKRQRWMMMTNWARIVSSFCHQQRLRSRIRTI